MSNNKIYITNRFYRHPSSYETLLIILKYPKKIGSILQSQSYYFSKKDHHRNTLLSSNEIPRKQHVIRLYHVAIICSQKSLSFCEASDACSILLGAPWEFSLALIAILGTVLKRLRIARNPTKADGIPLCSSSYPPLWHGTPQLLFISLRDRLATARPGIDLTFRR
ncbi:hypothetical protein PUN28_008618 [Cardiocondyla obscurior]|uniref:Uncharacterized protein n=1 Tax=Cardiocondyla obscurior TaxID=286306 RepID=A0AAW2G3J5_9HYME